MDAAKQRRLFILAICEIVCGAVFLLFAVIASILNTRTVQVNEIVDSSETVNSTEAPTAMVQIVALPSSLMVVVSILDYLFPVLLIITGVLGVVFVKKSINAIKCCRICLNILLSVVLILLCIGFFIGLITFVITGVLAVFPGFFVMVILYFCLTLFMSITLIYDLVLCYQKNGKADYRSPVQTQSAVA